MRTIAITAAVLMLLSTNAAHSAEPDPGNSIVPAFIDLVGMHQGVPDPAGAFSVTVRDGAGGPMPGVTVTIDFSGCPDLAPASQQPYPGLTSDCGLATVSAVTDADGRAEFVIVGSVTHRSTNSSTGCARIRAGAGDVLLGQASVAVYDEDGVNGVDAHDLSLWWCDFEPCVIFCPPPKLRSDFNHSLQVNAPDLPLLLDRYFDETSSETGARCDGQPTLRPTLRASEGGLNLAWSECISGGGTGNTAFACNTNAGSHSMVFSVVAPPGITGLTAFEADAIVVGGNPQQPLPDWWRADAAGCRGPSAISVSLAGNSGSLCDDALPSAGLAARMSYPYSEAYGGRIRIVGFVPRSEPAALTAGQEYALFRLTISHARTTGSPSCACCEEPVQVTFRSLKLIQGGSCAAPAVAAASGEPDVLIDYPASANRVYWQSTFTAADHVPAGGGLQLGRVGPNPRRDLEVELRLPTAGPATLALYDVRGTRISTRTFASTPGHHRVTLARTDELRPGVYFVRLDHGGEWRLLKASIIR